MKSNTINRDWTFIFVPFLCSADIFTEIRYITGRLDNKGKSLCGVVFSTEMYVVIKSIILWARIRWKPGDADFYMQICFEFNNRDLLRRYSKDRSDEAFGALVERHVNLVFSIASRRVGNSYPADGITLIVFTVLTIESLQLRRYKSLSSWLFRTSRFIANDYVWYQNHGFRSELEKHRRCFLNESEDDNWRRIGSMLDAAIEAMDERDRRAIILRLDEGHALSEVGAAMSVSADATERQVNRALEKLRRFFKARRGYAI